MEKPICEVCTREGRRYSVEQPLYGITTLVCPSPAYWDEEGVFHEAHNPNTTTFTYRCSNGHSWSKSI